MDISKYKLDDNTNNNPGFFTFRVGNKDTKTNNTYNKNNSAGYINNSAGLKLINKSDYENICKHPLTYFTLPYVI